jgi:hypothetical protein
MNHMWSVCNEECTEKSHYFCIEGERCLNNSSTICKLLFALFRFKVYIMQTLMELIETCINKEPNANPSDVSPNVVLFVSYCLHY